MVRTVPVIDRLWSNVGLGYGSGFLNQVGFSAFYFRFRSLSGIGGAGDEIIFDPRHSRYRDSPSVSYSLDGKKKKRLHVVSYFTLGNDDTVLGSNGDDVTFFCDTGNDGVSLNDPGLISNLAKVTGGMWLPNDEPDPANYGVERLYVPFGASDAPEWKVALRRGGGDDDAGVLDVKFPGWKWVIKSFKDAPREDGLFPTIFVTYEKNVLGLPFLSPTDVNLVFDDELLELFFVDAN
jgi:hypothetical protein